MNTTALYWPLFIGGEMFLGKLYVFSRSILYSITLFHQYIRDNMICIVHKFTSKAHCSYPIICNEDEPSFGTLSLFCKHNTVTLLSQTQYCCSTHQLNRQTSPQAIKSFSSQTKCSHIHVQRKSCKSCNR